MKKINIILLFLILTISTISAQTEKQYNVGCIAFYNIENLFDTLPGDNDMEFTPEAPKNWNTQKYFEKIDNIANVISQIGADVTGSAPAIIGLSEIENITVLEDLVKAEAIKRYNYQIVHIDGSDRRGVDCALLYRPEFFKVKNVSMYKLVTDIPNFITRDQITITGEYDGEEMTFIVLHWPSRSGGEKASRPKRAAAADLTRHIVDSILNVNAEAKIVVMGDLNDDPVDPSVKKHLKTSAKKDKNIYPSLYNPMDDLFKKGIGSLAYDDNWNLFDQIVISPSFLTKGNMSSYRFYQVHIFNKPYLLQKEGRFKGYPLRTYVGNTYMGGYSDHLPVYIFVIKEI